MPKFHFESTYAARFDARIFIFAQQYSSRSPLPEVNFKVSVVIPVYNAEEFVGRAVRSALQQPETHEVILVEDKSPDNCYRICSQLCEEHARVQLYTHPDHQNLGAGASRNLGIRQAKAPFIAFLDADDFYCPERFKHIKHIFESYPKADGVCDAVGVHFEAESARANWKTNRRLATYRKRIAPENLFLEQDPVGSKGYVHMDGLTVRQRAFHKAGLLNPDLRLHQDTDLIMRLAIACRMYPGKLNEPVAMRGIHANNRITAHRSRKESFTMFVKMLSATWQWALNNGYDDEAEVLEDRYVEKCNERLIYGKESLGQNRHLEAAGWVIQLAIGLQYCPPKRRIRLLGHILTSKIQSLVRRLKNV